MSRNTPGALPGVAVVLLVCLACLPCAGAGPTAEARNATNVLLDSDGFPLLGTGMALRAGDEFISMGGYRYEVQGRPAARAVGNSIDRWQTVRRYDFPKGVSYARPQASSAGTPTVGLYFSHSLEGYVPGADGTPLMRVQGLEAAVTEGLQREGLGLVGLGPGRHAPTATSFAASRSEARGLARAGAAALLDLHRDTAPAPYIELPPGQERASSTLMVVSRSHPAWQRNLGFALAWKGLADALAPGLVRGILIVSSSLNQDLSPRSLLLVVGDRFHNPAWAQRGVEELVAMLPGVLLIPDSGVGAAAAGQAGLVVPGLTFGYRGWFLSAVILTVGLVGAVALYQDRRGGAVLGTPWQDRLRGWYGGARSYGSRTAQTVAAFLGGLPDRARGRKH